MTRKACDAKALLELSCGTARLVGTPVRPAARCITLPVSFEGENEGARLNRRKRNWIADVQFEAIS